MCVCVMQGRWVRWTGTPHTCMNPDKQTASVHLLLEKTPNFKSEVAKEWRKRREVARWEEEKEEGPSLFWFHSLSHSPSVNSTGEMSIENISKTAHTCSLFVFHPRNNNSSRYHLFTFLHSLSYESEVEWKEKTLTLPCSNSHTR